MLKEMKFWKVFLVAFVTSAMLSCGDDDGDQAQVGLWLALEDGVSRAGCDLDSNNGSVSCPNFSASSSCITLDLRDNGTYTLSINVDGEVNEPESGSFTIEEGKIELCPIAEDCYDVPVVDAGLNDMTIRITNEDTACVTTIKMEKN